MPYKREGSPYWYIRIKGIRCSSGTADRAEAVALEAKLRHDAWLQQKMGVKPARTWQEAAVRWLTEKAHKRSIKDDRDKLKWLHSYLGDVRDIRQINRDTVQRIAIEFGVTGDTASSRNSTFNRYVALISGILNAAERKWEWGNRAPELRRYPEPDSKGRALRLREWLKLETQLPDHLQLAARFSLATGLREAKVFGLTWSQVESGILTFSGTKNKLGNSVPLNSTAMMVLSEIRRNAVVHATHVFTYNCKPMKCHGKNAWKKAIERAGIDYVRWHDLRHTFNSWLAQNGVPAEIRKRLVGHKTKEVHDRYTHLNVEHLRPYAEVIDRVLGLESSQPADKNVTVAV